MKKPLLALSVFWILLLGTFALADSLGTVSSVQTVACSDVGWCGGTASKSLTKLTVTGCPGYQGNGTLPDQDVVLGINYPTGPSKGAVTYMAGGGGNTHFDQQFASGVEAIQPVVDAGYTTVQMSFQYAPVGGTLTGWFLGSQGLRALACRPATVAQWVYQNIRQTGTPFGHVGNSGGSSYAVFAIGDYNVLYDFVELGSGPTQVDLTRGCFACADTIATACGEGSQPIHYQPSTSVPDVDPAYGTTSACSLALPAAAEHFVNDGVLHPGATLKFPNVYIDVLLGGQDTSVATGQASYWVSQVQSAKSFSVTCCPTCGHNIPGTPAGSSQIVANVLNFLGMLVKSRP